MHFHGFTRVGIALKNPNPVCSLRLLPVRCITTKQPTKATAAATKPDLYDDEELEKKLGVSEEDEPNAASTSGSSSHLPRKKWQATSTKKWVKAHDELPVHTCETKEEYFERKRVTFFQFAPDADDGKSVLPGEKPTLFHLFKRGEGMDLKNVMFFRSVLKVDLPSIRDFANEKRMESEVEDQTFRKKRVEAVGPELAAAHFMVFRGGRVRFHGQSEWIKKDEYDEYDLPGVRVENLFVKDIDASGTDLLYEGLENFKDCQKLKSLNLSHCKFADNFFIDRINLYHANTLESLDISYCPNISVGGITALTKLKKLKHLNVEGLHIPYLALACLTLEDEMPGLQITGMSYILEELDMLPDHEVQLVNSRLADVTNVSERPDLGK